MQLLPKKSEDYSFLDPILKIVNSTKNSERKSLESSISGYKRDIDYYLKTVEDYKQKLEDNKKQLLTLKDESWEMQDLITALKLLEKHQKIKWAFIDKDLNLIVLSQMIYAYNAPKDEQTKEPVGRYLFKIDLRYHNIYAHALDLSSQDYRHPNIMSGGYVCWGGLDYTVLKMFKAGEFYNAIDTLLFFFSAFPHDGGSHRPLYWLIWLNKRKVAFEKNEWIDRQRIYTIGRFTKPKKIPIEIKTQNFVTIDGKKIDITNLDFRNY